MLLCLRLLYSLQNFPPLSDPDCAEALPSITFNQNISFEAVKEYVSALKMQLEEKLDGIFKQEVAKIYAAGQTNILNWYSQLTSYWFILTNSFILLLFCFPTVKYIQMFQSLECEYFSYFGLLNSIMYCVKNQGCLIM